MTNDSKNSCIFCNLPKNEILNENEYAVSVYDAYPVTQYHTLIIPKRHIGDYFNLTKQELNSIQELIIKQKYYLQNLDSSITAFNIGINNGKDAGQTIPHTHIHLIPRRKNDTKNPEGGIRGVIPNKQKYPKSL